jgi:capsular exopolysaccharide synthesis family protein
MSASGRDPIRQDLAYPSAQKHVMDYLRVIYKRRFTVIAVFLVVFTVGTVNTLRETPIYQSHLLLLIESDTPKVARLDQMFQDTSSYDDEFRQTQFRILRSRRIARRTIDAMRLWDRPRLGNGPQPRTTFDAMKLLSKGIDGVVFLVKRASGTQTAPPIALPAEKPRGETAKESARIDEFLGGLAIQPVTSSRMVQIVYTSTDPIFAADAANAVARTYIEDTLEFRLNVSKEAADWLSERLGEYRRALQTSESALQAFREKNGAVSVADASSNIVVQRLTDLNGALTKAKTERINKEALYNQLKAAEASGMLDTSPVVLANEYVLTIRNEVSDLQRQVTMLGQRYGDRNAEMIKARGALQAAETKLKTELSKVVESVNNEYLASVDGERNLQAALDAQKKEALTLNRKGIEFGVLQREVESNKQIYESLMQRTKETGISTELRASNVRVIDPAEEPRAPISPDIRRGVTVTLGVSLALALGLAFGLEYLDNRIRTPEQLRNNLGLAFLGIIPAIRHRELHGDSPLLDNGVPSRFGEAIRCLRTSILFSSAEEGAKSLVVTSTGPGEGKTLIASNIAIALAQAGQRVLLVDADMRRPRLHVLFAHDLDPGLSNVIVGDSDQIAAIRASRVPGLSVLAAGHQAPNPSELLGSCRFKNLVDDLKKRFDWVVIDSPPVMAVTDACVLAHAATGVLFVVGAEMTRTGIASVALDQLEAANARFVGGVLNWVQVHRHGYYYSQYYNHAYADTYAKPAQT